MFNCSNCKTYKILIIEDDEKLRNELKIFLNKNGYQVETIEKFNDTIQDIIEKDPDLILLDINLPNIDGQYICKEIRKKSDMAIIIITSKDNEIDELISINYGADQYITKPFNIQILLAKIASLLRRTIKETRNQEKIDCGEFIINLSKSTIIRDKREIELTKNEFKILHHLVQNRGKIVSREEIMECLWDNECFIDDNTLTVNITRLRNKLNQLDLKEIIETRRGQGYILK